MISLSRVSKKFVVHSRINLLTWFRRVNKTSARRTILALDNIDLDIKKGETLGIIGPNGSGKSTLLRIIAGIYKPTTGVCRVCAEAPALYARIKLFPEISVKENIFLFGTLLGLNRRTLIKVNKKIIDFSGLGDFADAEARILSEGMRERLAFAIGAETCKDIWLLDEAILAGDGKFKEQCLEVIMRLKKEQKTIILASHDLKIISELCDNSVLLRKGRISAYGKTGEVIHDYLKALEG